MLDSPPQSCKSAKPRRNLSVSDMNAPRGHRLQHSSLSDLTVETFTQSPNEPIHELEFQMKYCEVVTIPGVSDIPDLYSLDDECDLPSAPFGGHTVSFSERSKPQASVVLSLHYPYKLLIVTQDFCDFFRYTVDSEICGRALKTLYGPRTDSSAIESGIHGVAMNDAICNTIVLYNRDGEGVQVKARFSPFMSDPETLAGCLLELTHTNDD